MGKHFDDSFAKHYSTKMGKTRKAYSLDGIAADRSNLSDESIVEQWSENVYYQYLGEGGLNCLVRHRN